MRKEEARQKARLKRARLDAGDVLGLSVGVADNFVAHPALLKGCKTVCSFLPIARQKEVDTWHLVAELPQLLPGCQIAVPWMQAEDQDFAPCLIGNRENLIAGPFGMPMPAHKDLIHPEDIDLVLVPLLAYDQRGYRVGFGGGYYDRFLRRCRPGVRKVGLDFFGPIADRFEDVWEGDVRLDAVVTPGMVYSFG